MASEFDRSWTGGGVGAFRGGGGAGIFDVAGGFWAPKI